MPRIEIEHFDRDEDRFETSTETFDRIAFAERAVALVRPPMTTVAICGGSRRVFVRAGRQWGKQPGARWAILGVPPNASRRAIAGAVLELLDGRAKAWALDVLMTELGGATSPLRRAAL